MRGVDVDVRAPVPVTDDDGAQLYDALGEPVTAWGEPVTVPNVIAVAGATSDSLESNRPEGASVAYTLAFPSSYGAPLRGCEVRVHGDPDWYRIAGDPRPTPDGQLRRPLRWNRTAEAVRDDG